MIWTLLTAAASAAEQLPGPVQAWDTAGRDPSVSVALQWIVLLTSLSFLPALVLLTTPFTRFVIVFSLLRQALGLSQSPPNQVIIGLSLLLSMALMQPTWSEVDREAVQPYLAGAIDTPTAYERAIKPLRTHMLANTRREELSTAIRVARISRPNSLDELPTSVVITGYVLSELEAAFVAGVKVYVPFLVVDLVVASVLLGMGMMMLPPVVISLPFKLLLFVLMDGWSLLFISLAASTR